MKTTKFDFSRRLTKKNMEVFADLCLGISERIGFKVSSRGWCYLMEQAGYINKNEFDKVENWINRCRKDGALPVDFVAEEEARLFKGVEKPSTGTTEDTLDWMLRDVLEGDKYYTPDWWRGEKFYIQVVVEKIDLKTLFEDVCKQYHSPIANARGWSSILQRADYARRFKEAEDMGLQCILLYCGDHDPDGLRISDTIRKNLEQIQDITWSDGKDGYNPRNLRIERFGLNYDFIIKHKLTWIDNLITGNQNKLMDLSKPNHPNHKLPYVQQYLKKVGARKCEANAIVTIPDVARDLIDESITNILGNDAISRFAKKRQEAREEYRGYLESTNLIAPINEFLNR